jgi:hypothetical protein
VVGRKVLGVARSRHETGWRGCRSDPFKITQITQTYVYDDQNIIEEGLSSGQTNDFVQGPGTDRLLAQRDQASMVSYYLADHLASVDTQNRPLMDT